MLLNLYSPSPRSIDNDLTKIVWTISYMKAGWAGHWATHKFEHKARSGHLHFIDWLDFEDKFQKDFMPLTPKLLLSMY